MVVALLLAGLTGLILALYYGRMIISPLLRFRRIRAITAKMPGPPAHPILGNFLELACPLDDMYDRIVTLADTYGPIFRMRLGHLNFVAVLDPDDMEVVLTSPRLTDKSEVYGALEPLMGSGLAILGGEAWRRHRKAITPSLHLDILKDFVDIFHKKGVLFASHLGELAEKGVVFDVTPLCGACANNAICETVMSTDVREEDRGRQAFLDAVPKALDHFMYRVWHPWLLSEWAYSMTSYFPEYQNIKNALNDFTREIIRLKKSALDRENQQPKRRRQAFLDHVLSSEEGAALSETELAEEVKTLVSIASGSSMDALSFVLYTLALRQDEQDKVVQELDDILGEDRSRPVQASDLPHMKYLECFIKEVFRYFAVVPIFARSCSEDIKLPSGYIVPGGCQIAFWLPYVHMNSRWFPDPKKFDPDRFLPENSRGRHPFAFIPFSAGPRNCIGQRYAMMFLKTVTATLLTRLQFQVPLEGPRRLEDVRLKMNLTLSVRDGANIRVLRRPPANTAASATNTTTSTNTITTAHARTCLMARG